MEDRTNRYTDRTGIQYLNAKSNTDDKRELRAGIARAACNDLGTSFGTKSLVRAPSCVRVCVHTRCPFDFIIRLVGVTLF